MRNVTPHQKVMLEFSDLHQRQWNAVKMPSQARNDLIPVLIVDGIHTWEAQNGSQSLYTRKISEIKEKRLQKPSIDSVVSPVFCLPCYKNMMIRAYPLILCVCNTQRCSTTKGGYHISSNVRLILFIMTTRYVLQTDNQRGRRRTAMEHG